MWTADRWKDYEVLDCSGGEKLERWGRYVLRRPDPQVIWNTTTAGEDGNRYASDWSRPNGHYHRSNKGGGEWEFHNLPEEWTIQYPLMLRSGDDPDNAVIRPLTFRLKSFAFKHTGLFPEQAVNWDWFSSIIYSKKSSEPDRQIKVLNLFAYTGGATIAAAAAGANVTHVDASKGMVTWARENAIESGLEDAPIRWLVDDCKKFVEREIRRGNKYDGIIMDPPSYGRGPKGEIWKIEENVYELILLAVSLLSDNALFFLINSYTTGLQPAVLTYMLSTAVSERGLQLKTNAPEGTPSVMSSEIGLPVSRSGLILPCGASGRWSQAKPARFCGDAKASL